MQSKRRRPCFGMRDVERSRMPQASLYPSALSRNQHLAPFLQLADSRSLLLCAPSLKVFDEGQLTDSQGHRVDFRNTLMVLTSNLGSDALARLPSDASSETMRDAVMDDVRAHFTPELLNRIDEAL